MDWVFWLRILCIKQLQITLPINREVALQLDDMSHKSIMFSMSWFADDRFLYIARLTRKHPNPLSPLTKKKHNINRLTVKSVTSNFPAFGLRRLYEIAIRQIT
ncbi:10442_t:CDS:2 [Ambispora leptoticha]|uniref:10442_t:CDS:1 n=1 Tax=Ambispora leptoticha TaxID=144679 RepID=A0A9N9DCZ3_9GLOM|nr:10442_t:CDS:2 [Ambispora leptoticha]